MGVAFIGFIAGLLVGYKWGFAACMEEIKVSRAFYTLLNTSSKEPAGTVNKPIITLDDFVSTNTR